MIIPPENRLDVVFNSRKLVPMKPKTVIYDTRNFGHTMADLLIAPGYGWYWGLRPMCLLLNIQKTLLFYFNGS